MKSPNKLIYYPANYLARIYTRFLKNHHFHNPQGLKVKGPAIVISNHTSFFDFLYVMWAIRKTTVNFVVARKYYETKPLSKILKIGATIPKSLFQPDIEAINKMLKVLKNNGIVGIFPEGQISVTGVTLPFPKGIGRLVKKGGVDVYGVKTTGAYLKDPPWTNNPRKGRIDSTLIKILNRDELIDITPDDIEKRLYDAIYTNPYLESNNHLFKGKDLAKDLDKLIYICPQCFVEGKIISQGDLLICESCHQQLKLYANGHLLVNDHQITLEDLYLLQRDIERKKIQENDDYQFDCDVKVESIVNQNYQIVSSGRILINKREISYHSDDDYTFKMKTNQIRYVPFDNGKNFQIYRDNMIYQFIPEQPYLCSKATNIIELMYELNKQS